MPANIDPTAPGAARNLALGMRPGLPDEIHRAHARLFLLLQPLADAACPHEAAINQRWAKEPLRRQRPDGRDAEPTQDGAEASCGESERERPAEGWVREDEYEE